MFMAMRLNVDLNGDVEVGLVGDRDGAKATRSHAHSPDARGTRKA
jgi:hypothetical protein